MPALLLVFLLSPLAVAQQTTSSHTSAEEERIREAVVRQQMLDWIRGSEESVAKAKDKLIGDDLHVAKSNVELQCHAGHAANEKIIAKETNFKFFFVSIDGQDPKDRLLKRLHDIPGTI
jgi:hypothetical protein